MGKIWGCRDNSGTLEEVVLGDLMTVLPLGHNLWQKGQRCTALCPGTGITLNQVLPKELLQTWHPPPPARYHLETTEEEPGTKSTLLPASMVVTFTANLFLRNADVKYEDRNCQ